jgi:hypothetical protein
VATSTHGITGVGWPSNRLPSLRKLSSSSSEMAPAALKQAYRSGEACPFEKTRWSPAGLVGSSKSSFRCPSSSTAIRSAADMEDVGWPEPPASLLRIESTRSCCASSWRKSLRSILG